MPVIRPRAARSTPSPRLVPLIRAAAASTPLVPPPALASTTRVVTTPSAAPAPAAPAATTTAASVPLPAGLLLEGTPSAPKSAAAVVRSVPSPGGEWGMVVSGSWLDGGRWVRRRRWLPSRIFGPTHRRWNRRGHTWLRGREGWHRGRRIWRERWHSGLIRQEGRCARW